MFINIKHIKEIKLKWFHMKSFYIENGVVPKCRTNKAKPFVQFFFLKDKKKETFNLV